MKIETSRAIAGDPSKPKLIREFIDATGYNGEPSGTVLLTKRQRTGSDVSRTRMESVESRIMRIASHDLNSRHGPRGTNESGAPIETFAPMSSAAAAAAAAARFTRHRPAVSILSAHKSSPGLLLFPLSGIVTPRPRSVVVDFRFRSRLSVPAIHPRSRNNKFITGVRACTRNYESRNSTSVPR